MYPENEWRKLGKNLTRWELAKINHIIHNNNFRFNTYSEKRSEDRNINEMDIIRTIKYGTIIEFHYKNGSPRVLIRGKEIVDGMSICVVLDLYLKLIITVYKNEIVDNHYTLHKELYSCRDIMKYLNIG